MPNVESSRYYDMSGEKFLCIFNHEIYDKKSDYYKNSSLNPSRRYGTHHDVERLTNTFADLGYKVAIYNDLLYDEIVCKLAAFCQSDHEDTSCIVVAILSHGRASNELMARDRPYLLTDVCNILHNGNLKGKPKILFIQACRDGHSNDKTSYIYPTPPDFLIMYASCPDYVAYRTKEKGSYLINAICDVLKEVTKTDPPRDDEKETVKKLTYAEFITRVNQRVATVSMASDDPKYNLKKQIPETRVTFMKSLVFWPKDGKQIIQD